MGILRVEFLMNNSKLGWIRQFVCAAFLAALLGPLCFGQSTESAPGDTQGSREGKDSSQERAEIYARLFESIMVREGPDGKRYGLDEIEPLLWQRGEFLLKGASRERFLAALDAFVSQSAQAFDSYTDVQRAVMQRHLWAVFDWAANRGRGRSEERRVIQRELVPVIRRLSLSRDAIKALPDTHAATANGGRYATDPDPKDRFKPFFPARLFEPNGPWVCLTSYPLITETHAEDDRYRSAFTVFARLPGGRKATIEYFKKLTDFRDHWTPVTPEGEILAIPRTNVFANRETPQFPTGTRFALVRRAFLVDDKGEIVASPLIESIQLRAYNRLHYQAVAEFAIEPRKLIAGQAAMRARRADEPGFRLLILRRYGDPFLATTGRSTSWDPPWRNGGTAPLKSCTDCHSTQGIHSVGSRNETFNMHPTGDFRGVRSLVPPRLRPARPEDTWKATIRGKWATYEWGLLQGLWNR